MATISPKTIIITTFDDKIPSFDDKVRRINIRRCETAAAVITPAVSLSAECEQAPRKRRRMTNMSPEERMLRRKLKNRVAAQTARDRKKQHMGDLEEALADIEVENQRLQRENMVLRTQGVELRQENRELREKLGMPSRHCVVERREHGSRESAVLTDPLQREPIRALLHLTTHYLTIFLTLGLISLSTMGMCHQQQKQQEALLSSEVEKANKRHIEQATKFAIPSVGLSRWWGPQQQSWNPSKN